MRVTVILLVVVFFITIRLIFYGSAKESWVCGCCERAFRTPAEEGAARPVLVVQVSGTWGGKGDQTPAGSVPRAGLLPAGKWSNAGFRLTFSTRKISSERKSPAQHMDSATFATPSNLAMPLS